LPIASKLLSFLCPNYLDPIILDIIVISVSNLESLNFDPIILNHVASTEHFHRAFIIEIFVVGLLGIRLFVAGLFGIE